MLFAKEINGVVCVKRYRWNEVSEWKPVTVGSNPTTCMLSDKKYLIAFEFLSHVYYICLDPAVWPPFFTNPFDNQGAFQQIKGAIDFVAVSSQSSCACVTYPPVALIYLKASNLYLANGTTYTTYVSLDFSKFSTPFWCKGYRLYQRKKGGPWTMIGDWASDFQNIQVTEEGTWTSEFCATWAWDHNPDLPNSNASSNWLESDINKAPILTIPMSPISLAVLFSDVTRVGSGNYSAVVSALKGEFLASTATDVLICGATNSSIVAAQDKGAFITAPDGLEMVCVSSKHDSSGVIGGIRG